MPGTATVSIGLKLSFPFVMNVADGHWEDRQGPQGTVKVFVRSRTVTHTVRGIGSQRRLESNYNLIGETDKVIGGFGITHGIPADFAERWFKENAESDMVKNGLIFMHSRASFVAAQAKERRELVSGTEAIDPSKVYEGGIKKRTERDNE